MSAPFRRVVVPLDGTPLSEAILPVAVDLAAACQATIVLLHIVEAGAPATVHGHPHLAESAQADAYLEMVAARYRSTGIQFETHVHTNRERDVAQSIARHVGELHADLIAMSTHGPGGLRAFLTASIGQQALRHVSIPVLLMRPAEQPFGSYHCRVIGVPLDGTAMAETALPLAMALTERTGSELILVRVVPTVSTIPSTHGPAATLLPAATSELLRLEEDEAREYLGNLMAAAPATVSTVAVVRRGDPVEQLTRAINDHAIDLVVMSTHGKSGLSGLWSGSVAAKLLARVDRPVILVPLRLSA